MNNEFYSVKDIIFGTRAEYQNMQSKLNKLKELVMCTNKGVRDYNFSVNGIIDNKFNIQCKFIQRIDTLKGILMYIQLLTNTYPCGNEFGRLVKDNDGRYFIDNYRYNILVKEEDVEKLNNIIDEILSSNFVREMDFKHFYNDDNLKNSLSIFPRGISGFFNYFGYSVYFGYLANEDLINVGCNKNLEITDELIYYILDCKFESNNLSNYHKNIIKNDFSHTKRIEIVDGGLDQRRKVYNIITERHGNHADLYIEEKENNICLRKVKTKKKIGNIN